MKGTEYKVDLPEGNLNGVEGVMSVAVKTERGHTLTHEYGFTVEEENGKVLAFDLLEHEDLGTTLLFGNQVFALKFWNDEDIHMAMDIISTSMTMELQRRADIEARETS